MLKAGDVALMFATSLVLSLCEYNEDNATSVSVREFKDSLIAKYSGVRNSGKVDEGLIYCMLTHKFLPKSLVIGSHLWKRQWAK